MDSALAVPSRVRPAASLIERTVANEGADLEAGDSAYCALTDLRRNYPITVEVDSFIDDAFGDMNRLGVHALLVTQQEIEGVEQQVVGLITYYDIERRLPRRHPHAVDSGERSGICVSEVMMPWNELSLIRSESLQTLTAYDLYEMFQGTGLTHILVVEMHGDESATAIGLVSRATLAKRLRGVRTAG